MRKFYCQAFYCFQLFTLTYWNVYYTSITVFYCIFGFLTHTNSTKNRFNYFFFLNCIARNFISAMENDSVCFGPNSRTLVDLKRYLREERPLQFQVLENYLKNAANLIRFLIQGLFILSVNFYYGMIQYCPLLHFYQCKKV